MKFISTQQKLNQGLLITEKIIAKNLTLPILQNTLVSCSKKTGIVTLCSTDLEMGVEVAIIAKIEEEGSITAPTKLLSAFVKSLPNDNLEITEKNKTVVIQCAGYKSNIKTETANEFPIIPNPQNVEGIKVGVAGFVLGISSVISSASVLDIKPEIAGVYVQINENEMCFTATDSFRLAEKRVGIENKTPYIKKFILPKKVCDTLLRILQDLQGDMQIALHNNQIIMKTFPEDSFGAQIRFVGRIIDGEYPDYEQIIPSSFTTTAEIAKDEFIRRVRAASLFSNKINEVTLCLNGKKQQLEIFSNDPEYGDHLSVIPCKIKGNEEKVSFNYTYLLDGLANIRSHNILVKLNNTTSPVLIQPQENEGLKYVIMPIKT